MKKKFKTPTLVTTAILTVITIVFWIAFEVYHILTTKPAPVVPAPIVNPINPALDVTTLNKLKQRMQIDEASLVNKTPAPITVPTVQPTTIPSATPIESSTPSATPTSTSSGGLSI